MSCEQYASLFLSDHQPHNSTTGRCLSILESRIAAEHMILSELEKEEALTSQKPREASFMDFDRRHRHAETRIKLAKRQDRDYSSPKQNLREDEIS